MPLIIDSLGFAYLSAYRKVRCRAQVTSAFDMRKVVADVLINGSVVGTIEVDLEAVGGSTYEAELNAATFVQDFLAPNGSIDFLNRFNSLSLGNDNNAPYQSMCADLYCRVNFSAQYFYEDSTTGKLVNLGVTETLSNDFDALAATAQHLEPENAFFPYVSSIFNPQLFLTNAPRTVEICNDDAHYLAFLVDNGTFAGSKNIRVRTFDSSGTLIDEGVVDILADITAGGGRGVFATGVGVANLATQTYDSGSVTLPNSDVSYYIIDLGLGTAGSFSAESEEYRFDIVPCCDDYKVNLFFMNNKSGFDRLAFQYIEETTSRSSNTIQRPVPYPFNSFEPVHSPRFKGKFPVNIESETSYTLQRTVKTQSEAPQLKDLISSPEVYAEINGTDLQPVIIENATSVTDLKDDLAQFEITIKPANSLTTMRN